MITLIWDLDGTLIDSYPAILEALKATYQTFGLLFDPVWVKKYIIQESVGHLLDFLAHQHDVSASELKAVFSYEQEKRDDQIILLPYAKDILNWTKEVGIVNLMYTHKGDTTRSVLDKLEILDYFTEILTSASGFLRKPDPEAINYLMVKYHLDKDKVYYVGDRRLDVEVAKNAGILSLNLNEKDTKINQKIKNLLDIKNKLTM